MMHTTNMGDTTFHHNGDYSGYVVISVPTVTGEPRIVHQTQEASLRVPMADLEQLVAEKWRSEVISYIEEMPFDRSEIRDAMYAIHRFIFRSA